MKSIKGSNDFYGEERDMDKSLVLLIGFALIVFGIVQLSSTSSSVYSNPLILQNLTSQGYTTYFIYAAPPFLSSYILVLAGLYLIYKIGGFKWKK